MCHHQGNDCCRSAERQRLEHVRSPHARDWAQSLRDLSTELQPSFQVHTLTLPALKLLYQSLVLFSQPAHISAWYLLSSSVPALLSLTVTAVDQDQHVPLLYFACLNSAAVNCMLICVVMHAEE